MPDADLARRQVTDDHGTGTDDRQFANGHAWGRRKTSVPIQTFSPTMIGCAIKGLSSG